MFLRNPSTQGSQFYKGVCPANTELHPECRFDFADGDFGGANSNTNDPRQVLASAKTASIVSQIGEVAQTGRWMWDPNPEQLETHCRKRCRNGGVSRFLKKPITPIS